MKQKYTREIFAKHCVPRPELSDALEYFRSAGYKLAVASNSTRATVDLALERLGIRNYFDCVLSHEDVGRSKPDPEIFKECFRRLNVEPHQALVLEDSEPGLQAARDSHAPVFVVKYPSEVTKENILQHLHQLDKNASFQPTIEILVPMAGQGKRFVEAGFLRPKPFISVIGRPMIEWVVENVRPKRYPHLFSFLVAEEHLRNESHAALLRRIAPGCRIVAVPSTTQGAACTALLASDEVDADRPLLIVNSDQVVDFSIDRFIDECLATRCDGNILAFPATDPKWSYARLDAEGYVTEVAEKQPISPHATVGIYYFRQARKFQQSAEALIRNDRRTFNEFYLCPVYNELIAGGGKVRIHSISELAMHGLGTPEDLNRFLQYQLKASEERAPKEPS